MSALQSRVLQYLRDAGALGATATDISVDLQGCPRSYVYTILHRLEASGEIVRHCEPYGPLTWRAVVKPVAFESCPIAEHQVNPSALGCADRYAGD